MHHPNVPFRYLQPVCSGFQVLHHHHVCGPQQGGVKKDCGESPVIQPPLNYKLQQTAGSRRHGRDMNRVFRGWQCFLL